MKTKELLCAISIGTLLLSGCTSNMNATENSSTTISSTVSSAIDTNDLFTNRDLSQEPDLTGAEYITVESNYSITIDSEGVYVLSGTASEYTIYVDTDDESKVQIVLNNVSITNTSSPAIYVKNADKVFVTTINDSSLTVSDAFVADDENNLDAVIYSSDDLVLNGTGSLTISSSEKAVHSTDDLKITGGIYNVSAGTVAFYANDSICIANGEFHVTAGTDGFHAENKKDDTLGYVYIEDGTFELNVTDDAIHGTSIVQIDGGTFTINASEGIESTIVQINDGNLKISANGDGINAGQKSDSMDVKLEITGGTIDITVADGDTDGLDANGDLTITGGTITITTNGSAIDFDGTGTLTDGTVIINGEEISSLDDVNTATK